MLAHDGRPTRIVFDTNVWRHKFAAEAEDEFGSLMRELTTRSVLEVYFTFENLQELGAGRADNKETSFSSIFDLAYRLTRGNVIVSGTELIAEWLVKELGVTYERKFPDWAPFFCYYRVIADNPKRVALEESLALKWKGHKSCWKVEAKATIDRLRTIETVFGRIIAEGDILSAGVSLQDRADEVGIVLRKSACDGISDCIPFELLKSAYSAHLRACLAKTDPKAPKSSDLIDLEICASLCFADYLVSDDAGFVRLMGQSTDPRLARGVVSYGDFEKAISEGLILVPREDADHLDVCDVEVPLTPEPVRVWSYAPRLVYPSGRAGGTNRAHV